MQEYMYAGLRMRVPEAYGRRLVRWGLGAASIAGMLLPAGAWGAEKKPWVQLPMESLGIPAVSSSLLAMGGSVLTVNFIDDTHLLVTFELRKLVPRLEHDPEDHEDRLVGGEIVDLPDGHIEAQTEWHMHDHGRYLWSLRGGRFLIRIGDSLYTMVPRLRAGGGDAFARTLFPGRRERPSLVEVSDDGALVTVETAYEAPDSGGRTKVLLGDEPTEPVVSKTLIDFFRIGTDADGTVTATPAGHVGAGSPVLLPVDADGYLWPTQTASGVWAVTFDGFEGKSLKVGTIGSSCFPRLVMTSRSEFVALTCQGSDDKIKLASYGLDGSDTWEEQVGDFGRPYFAFAPAAARFAISGTDPGAQNDGTVLGGPDLGPRQEVRVYQNASGDMLLRVDCSPAFKTAENFDLSGDGMLAAVVRNGAIAVYKLPPLTAKDRSDMEEIAAFAPPATMADVTLKRLLMPSRVKPAAAADAPGSVGLPAPVPVAEGDAQPVGPRKRPTLLHPGEKPEFGSANPEPN